LPDIRSESGIRRQRIPTPVFRLAGHPAKSVFGAPLLITYYGTGVHHKQWREKSS
jgi:hypothetical protein